jgi:phosphoribosylformylglycinamidine synthase subunit PurL
VSLYNETDGRAIPPTPVVGCVGLVPDVRTIPRGWRPGDAVLLATAGEQLDIAAEAALVGAVWRAAPLLSFAHDVDAGDVGLALAEAAAWSGVEADADWSDLSATAGAVVIACAPDVVSRLGFDRLRQIGTVG